MDLLLLHDNLGSGNAYKVRLLLSHLGRPFRRIEYDVTRGETRTPEFLALNPDGRIPLLQFPDGRSLAQSNAIMFYLAQGTDYLPGDGCKSRSNSGPRKRSDNLFVAD